MSDYRAYIVDGPFNFTRAEFLHDHPDDATAIEAAKQLVDTLALPLEGASHRCCLIWRWEMKIGVSFQLDEPRRLLDG